MMSLMVPSSEITGSKSLENYVYYRETCHPAKPVFKGLAGELPQILFITGRYA